MTNLNLKGCSRCGGDLLVEDYLGDVELVCIQCGHRSMAPVETPAAYSLSARRKAKQNQKLAA